MMVSRGCRKQARAWRPLAACLLAAGWAISAGSTLEAADRSPLAWAPSRDEAVVVGDFASGMIADDSALSPALTQRRPRSLARPAPGRSPTYFTQAAPGAEALPSVTGQVESPEGLPVPEATYYEDETLAGPPSGSGYRHPWCDPCAPGGWNGWGGWGACAWIPICIFIPRPPLDGLELFGGVQGYTGPANRGGSGSFGFHQGFNWGMPICGLLNFQWGTNWTESNFDGNYLTADQRNQIFFTGGLYRRVDWGLQGGLVVDYLHDEWDYSADLTQLRGELSWLWCGCNEAGFWFTSGVNDASNRTMRLPVIDNTGNSVRFVDGAATLAVNDIYAFFFRRQFACGGQGRLFGGFTGHSQGLVGGDATVPLNPHWNLRSSFLYAVPGGDNTVTDPQFARESWNVSISLVWTPCPRPACGQNYNRPLFNVADNGTFLTRLLP